eukprot:g36677.t1
MNADEQLMRSRNLNLISITAPANMIFQTESLLSKQRPAMDNTLAGANAKAHRAVPATVHCHHQHTRVHLVYQQ